MLFVCRMTEEAQVSFAGRDATFEMFIRLIIGRDLNNERVLEQKSSRIEGDLECELSVRSSGSTTKRASAS